MFVRLQVKIINQILTLFRINDISCTTATITTVLGMFGMVPKPEHYYLRTLFELDFNASYTNLERADHAYPTPAA